MHEGQVLGGLIRGHGSLAPPAANRRVCQEQCVEFPFIEALLDRPAAVMARGQFDGGRGVDIQPMGDETAGGFRIGNPVEGIRDDAHPGSIDPTTPILAAGMEGLRQEPSASSFSRLATHGGKRRLTGSNRNHV